MFGVCVWKITVIKSACTSDNIKLYVVT